MHEITCLSEGTLTRPDARCKEVAGVAVGDIVHRRVESA
ncbi:hypothetical protein NSU_0707 [Novosphingobium pentaromativorans US6-1]|uniref:Uncharacterized protein n=1 Tax=Novosphingobium pentaromativorans US6-1 TaxID=1088721 RepID=G6E8N7_9SPHN|nr:hypothetical protein NSU_0707 [Novosphingobium pentaromativorans US6-1]